MRLDGTIEQAVRARTSVRSYLDEPVDGLRLGQLRAALDPSSTPFGSANRLDLVAAGPGESESLKGLGTYGVIRRPAGFMLGAVSDRRAGLVDFGFAMERAILAATDLGLGTCWLGGTFSRSTFATRLGLEEGEVVPAVVSLGVPTPRRGTVDRVFRWSARSHKRRPWEALFFDGALGRPLSPEAAGPLAHPLEMLRLAPSASNKQPWRVVHDRGALHLCLARDPGYSRTMRVAGMVDLHLVDAGIAMCHLELSAHERGLSGAWSSDDPGLALPDGAEHVATWTLSGA